MKKVIILVMCALFIVGFLVLSIGSQEFRNVEAQEISKEYPVKPVRIIIPWGAGGGTDRRYRILSSVMDKYLGQPLIVENRPGSAGIVATIAGANAEPDGYTLLVWHSGPMIIAPLTLGAPYDPVNDFEYVIQNFAYTRNIVAGIEAPFKDWPSFIKYAKAYPGKVKFGLGDGALGEGQIWLETIFSELGIKVTYIPFDSAAESAAAAAGGHVDLSIGTIPSAAPLVNSGKLIPILNSFVNEEFGYPGLKEYGLERFEYAQRNGVVAPKGTPKEIINKLEEAFRNAMKDISFLSMAKKTGELPVVLSGQELRELTKNSIEMMKEIVPKLIK